VLKLLRAQSPPCPWDTLLCFNAGGEGNELPLLQWAREQDPPCPWSVDVCYAAAFYARLQALHWMRSQTPPCPWNEEVVQCAVENLDVGMCVWMAAARPPCPFDPAACLLGLIGLEPPLDHVLVAWMRDELAKQKKENSVAIFAAEHTSNLGLPPPMDQFTDSPHLVGTPSALRNLWTTMPPRVLQRVPLPADAAMPPIGPTGPRTAQVTVLPLWLAHPSTPGLRHGLARVRPPATAPPYVINYRYRK